MNENYRVSITETDLPAPYMVLRNRALLCFGTGAAPRKQCFFINADLWFTDVSVKFWVRAIRHLCVYTTH